MEPSRRQVLKSTLALAASAGLPSSGPLYAAIPQVAYEDLVMLNCNSGVTLPPQGMAHLKFSFDFPEPSMKVGDWLVSFRVYTDENTYALDPRQIEITRDAQTSTLTCSGFTWAGGQERRSGHLVGIVGQQQGETSLTCRTQMPGANVTAISAIVRWLPRGEISVAAGEFRDPKQDEILHSWADLMGGMVSPLVVLRSGQQFTAISLAAAPDTVRNAKFYLQPGADGYRAELTYEREAWKTAPEIESPTWYLRRGSSYDEVARPHYEHVERAFGLQDWSTRSDVPAWMRHVSLVVSLHGADWTGYIFNDYARQLRILEWVAGKIDPAKVLVFLPAWDGRYYWNYPAYRTDPRMGGDDGFARLIKGAQKMGFHLVPMFGSNVANMRSPEYPNVRDALTVRPDGDLWYMNYVDWNNDRRADGNYGFMNLGVDSWRNHLTRRIVSVIQQFGVDGFFLDIAGTADNNRQADMFLGTRKLVDSIRASCPGTLAVGEMHYDALVGVIPVFQADTTKGYPEAFYKYGRMFEHLSWPAPGRGSTGVHEFGFSGRGKLPTAEQNVIPTLSVVDDTFSKYQKEMLEVIAVAKRWVGYSGKR